MERRSVRGVVGGWAWVPVLVLLISIMALWVADVSTAYGSPALLLGLNLLFGTVTSLAVALLVGRSFLAGGAPGLLLLGCGVVIWSAAAPVGVATAPDRIDVAVTIHNSCVWLAALCHLLGAVFSLRAHQPLDARRAWLVIAFTASVAAVGLVTVSALNAWMPTFFVQGQGGTVVRHLVLGSATAMFTLTAILLSTMVRRPLSRFVYWYALALLLIATGLFGVMLESVFGGLVSWTGRAAQFLGGVYMFIAALAALRESGARGIIVGQALGEALRASEARLKRAQQIANVGDWEWQIATGASVWSEQTYRLMGEEADQFTPTYEALRQRVHPEDRAAFDQAMERALTGTSGFDAEFRIVRPDGTARVVHSRGEVLRDAAGRPQSMTGVWLDITERKQAEAEIFRAQQRLQAVMQALPVGIAVLDAQGGSIESNPAFDQIWGGQRPPARSVEDYAAYKAWWLDSGKPVQPREWASARAVQYGETVIGQEMEIRRFDGTHAFVLNSAAPILDTQGRIIGSAVAVQDITERRRIERELDATARKYAAMFTTTSDGVWVHNLEGEILEVNEAYCRMSGYSRDELVRMPVSTLEARESPDEVAQHMRHLLERGGHDRFESRHRRKDGTVFDVDITALYLDIDGGRIAIFVRDITERKAAVQAVKASHDRLNAVLEQMSDAFVTFDRDWRYTRVNAAACQAFHMSAGDLLGNRVWELWPLAYDSPFGQNFRRASEQNTALQFEAFYPEPLDRWFECRCHPMADGLAVFFRDVTDRRHAQEALDQSRQMLETVVKHIPAAVNLIRGSDLRLQLVNPAYQAIAPGKDMVGLTLDELWPDTGKDFAAICRRVLETGEPYYVKDDLNIIRRTPDRPPEEAYFSWSLHRVRLPGNEGYGILNSAWETTARKRAEDALNAALEKAEAGQRLLEGLMEYVPEGITIADAPDVRIRMVSRAGRDLIGKRREVIEGITVEDQTLWDLYYADGITPARNEDLPLTRAVQKGEVVIGEEWVLAHPDGWRIPILCNAAPIRDAQGKIVSGVVAWRDITERKRAEEALKDAARRKDEFLAMLAHELRNPLAPIRNAVHLLRLVGPAEPRLEQARDLIDRQVTHMVRLIDDLLDVSRITRGKISLRKERVDLAAAVVQAAEAARPLMTRKRQTFTVSCAPETIELEADPARLVQVLSNLLNNAAKFTEPGGSITLSTERNGDEALIRVRDTGMGIAPELHPKIFDLFVQGETSLDRAEGGLGIGLTLVRHVVEQHGGRVEAHSAGRGCGSEFVVIWPTIASVLGVAEKPNVIPSATNGRRLRILVVEDNIDTAESFVALLEVQGHEIRVAPSGAAALDLASRFVPDVAFIDIGLPGLDGYEVARRLRALPDFRPTVLIALSGYGREEDKRRALEAGFDHHLTKPVDPTAIDRLLFEIGNRSEARLLQ